MSTRPQQLYDFGPYRLDTAEKLLLRDGEAVPLTPKAFETLVALVERSGHLVEKDELMKLVWADSFVEESNLTNNVYALRKLLGQGENGKSYIETVPRRGYRFTAPVRKLSPEALVVEKRSVTRVVTEETVADDSPGQLKFVAGEAHALVRTQPKSKWHWLSVSLMVLGLIGVGTIAVLVVRWVVSQPRSSESELRTVAFSEMSISRLTTQGKTKHAAISPDGKYVAQMTEDAEGDSLWVRQVTAPSSVRIAGPALTEFVWVTFAPSGDSVYYLTLDRNKGHTALYQVAVLGGPSSLMAHDVGPFTFSPDQKQITYIRNYGDGNGLVVASPEGKNERTLAERRQPEFFQGNWNAPAWSPDGKTIVCPVRLKDERGQHETILAVGVEDRSQRQLASARWQFVGQPVWLADGSGLMVTASESATAPAQIWHVAIKSGEATRVTHDLNDYYDLSLTADSSKLAAVQKHSVSSIWVAPEEDASRARQIASEAGWVQEVVWTPDGRIVYRSNAGGSAEIWVMNADGSNPKQLTAGARVFRGLAVSPDGRYIFFASDRSGRFNIWRVDADGSNLKQLTTGDDDCCPHTTPDAAWVVFQREEKQPRLWKVPAAGGESVQLTKTRSRSPAVSPDGQMIAYYYLDSDVEKSRWRIAVVSFNGGEPLQRFDFPPTVTPEARFVRWSPDQQSIAFANNAGGLSDIWLQPLNGSSPKQLTNFKAEQIIAFDWSRDGRSLAFVRSVEASDVVLIEQGQPR